MTREEIIDRVDTVLASSYDIIIIGYIICPIVSVAKFRSSTSPRTLIIPNLGESNLPFRAALIQKLAISTAQWDIAFHVEEYNQPN